MLSTPVARISGEEPSNPLWRVLFGKQIHGLSVANDWSYSARLASNPEKGSPLYQTSHVPTLGVANKRYFYTAWRSRALDGKLVCSIAFASSPNENPANGGASFAPAGSASETESHQPKHKQCVHYPARKICSKLNGPQSEVVHRSQWEGRIILPRYITNDFGHEGSFRSWQPCIGDEA